MIDYLIFNQIRGGGMFSNRIRLRLYGILFIFLMKLFQILLSYRSEQSLGTKPLVTVKLHCYHKEQCTMSLCSLPNDFLIITQL